MNKLHIDILGYWGGFPQYNEATAGIYLKTDQSQVLLDCGSGVMAKIPETYDFVNLDALILTHLHADHIADVRILQYRMNNAIRTGKRQRKLTIYTPASPQLEFDYLHDDYTSMVAVYDENTKLVINDLEFTFHRNIHAYEAYTINVKHADQKLSYCTDSEYQESLVPFVKGADLFICEATNTINATHSAGKGHMSDLEAAQLAESAQVKELVLFHLPSDGDIDLMVARAQSQYSGIVSTPLTKKLYTL